MSSFRTFEEGLPPVPPQRNPPQLRSSENKWAASERSRQGTQRRFRAKGRLGGWADVDWVGTGGVEFARVMWGHVDEPLWARNWRELAAVE